MFVPFNRVVRVVLVLVVCSRVCLPVGSGMVGRASVLCAICASCREGWPRGYRLMVVPLRSVVVPHCSSRGEMIMEKFVLGKKAVAAAAAMAALSSFGFAGTAFAADPAPVAGNATITLKSTNNTDQAAANLPTLGGRQFAAYKIGSYSNPTFTADGSKVQSLDVTADAAVKAAVEQAVKDAKIDLNGKPASVDTLAWVLAAASTENPNGAVPVTADQFRAFANSLAKQIVAEDKAVGGKDKGTDLLAPAADQAAAAPTDKTMNLTVPEGYYLIIQHNDANPVYGDDGFVDGLPVVVGTTIGNPDGKQLSTNYKGLTLGSALIKPQEVPVLKAADKKDASNGDKVGFTITSHIPNFLDVATYRLSDTDVDFSNPAVDDIHVTVDGKDVTADAKAHFVMGKSTKLTQDGKTKAWAWTDADDANSWYFDGSYLLDQANSGKQIVITYTATKNAKDAAGSTNESQNTVYGGATFKEDMAPKDGTSTVKVGSFEFGLHKVDKKGANVAGAKFTVQRDVNGDGKFADNEYIKLSAGGQDGKVAGDWDNVTNANDAAVFTTAADGTLSFKGLSHGDYKVNETKVADGFLDIKPVFTIHVDDKGAVTVTKTTAGDLVSDPANKVVTVTNVRNIPELSQTGAAGIVLTTLVAAMVAAGAVVIIRMARKQTAR